MIYPINEADKADDVNDEVNDVVDDVNLSVNTIGKTIARTIAVIPSKVQVIFNAKLAFDNFLAFSISVSALSRAMIEHISAGNQKINNGKKKIMLQIDQAK